MLTAGHENLQNSLRRRMRILTTCLIIARAAELKAMRAAFSALPLMALQTDSSTTSGSTTPTATHNPNDNDHNNNTFSPAGSPPLILAFLAIGLFSGAMVIVFGWRRVFGRPLPSSLLMRNPTVPKSTYVLPEKPKLWDMWDIEEFTWQQVSAASTGYHVRDWAKLMPLSARVISLGDQEEDETKDAPTSMPNARQAPLRDNLLDPHIQMFNTLRRPWQRTHSPPSQPAKDPQEIQPQQIAPMTPKTLQVGVAIILPSAQYPIYVRERTTYEYSEEKKLRKRKELPEFSIGLCDFEWE